ncbi:ras GTPase-activating protein-binding protein 2 isoform X2 [Amborella trichopoda]|uniref:NTF2 domain-containing protein n=1 Tax=Amborella trichopoda TaxID=13333 RepID=W1PCA0_AMBTC|nr:ras GTPase-activating protein-binding protein 2 isoform X2 [Amborella trichopoda]ERN07552.1 hypothetical protein AMTR_s00154p00067340 [Amborella trichopoda]|eukprot:XP_006845877.1 ras GTPase-activating protein-binding protein 2 isoform X2 [Amborella trichopoda]
MESQDNNSPPVPSAQVVGNAFVAQYYHILHQSPSLVYRFYQDSSVLGRPEPDGEMSSVTTMQAINDKILSLDYSELKAEIKTVDAQKSFDGGVIVLVTGYLTGKDNLTRKFTQSFFLAPQDKGFFVLNDVFRYVDESEKLEGKSASTDGISETEPDSPLTSELEPAPTVQEHEVSKQAAPVVENGVNNAQGDLEASDNSEGSVVEEEVLLEKTTDIRQKDVQSKVESPSQVQEDVPKKSYASIVKVMKENKAPMSVQVPTKALVKEVPLKVAPKNPDCSPVASPAPAPAPKTLESSNGNGPESSSPEESEAEGYSIYIGGLPMSATVSKVEEEFKKFGPIKIGGIQVRSNKGFCFGFVEFESHSSVESALKASPITIGGRQAFVEEKRTTTRVGRGRFPQGRGGFRNDGFRGRGNYGGRGYSRGDFGNRGDSIGRGRNYQRVDARAVVA